MKIAIDVTPILPGGEGGGAKQVLMELLRGFAKRARSDKFILLTSYKNHDVFSDFENLGMERMLMLEDPSVKQSSLIKRIINRIKTELTFYVMSGKLKRRGVSVLFCPMTAPYYAEVGIPTVSVVHDLQHMYYPSFFSAEELTNRNYVYGQLKRKADFVICVSSFTRSSVIEKLAMPPDKVFAVSNCVHSRLAMPSQQEREEVLAKFGLQGKKYCIFPANLWPHKNHKMLLVAFNMFIRRNASYDLHLILTGATIESDTIIKDAMEQMKLDDKVHFLGYLREDELAAIWSGSYALIFPSLFEGFGIPLVEAMMFRKPILASTATSIPEVSGDAALYFDPRRPDEIVDCLAKIMEDKGLYDSLVTKGQARLKNFDFDQMVDGYLSVLHKAKEQGSLVDFAEVTGVYRDGWAGPSIRVSFGASKKDRVLEMRASLPEWHPSRTNKIKLARSDGRSKSFVLRKKETLVIREHLPNAEGLWTMDISGGFIPNGGDTRTLTFMINDMVIVNADTGENFYDFKS